MGITRAEVLRRAEAVWRLGSVPYNMSAIHQPDGYRADCSGYLSMCWGIPLNVSGSWGGMNTVSLVTQGWMREIRPADLEPGDAVGMCGPGTAGADGHIQLFVGWLNQDPSDSRHYILEQAGGTSGPRKRLVNWTNGYRAYRYRDIISAGGSPPVITPGGHMASVWDEDVVPVPKEAGWDPTNKTAAGKNALAETWQESILARTTAGKALQAATTAAGSASLAKAAADTAAAGVREMLARPAPGTVEISHEQLVAAFKQALKEWAATS